MGRRVELQRSVWDKGALAAAFREAGVKPSHLTTLYKYGDLQGSIRPQTAYSFISPK